MSALDYNYVANLVVNAQLGDSNAFAELYAATYQREYHFAYCYLRDEHLAQDALQETYIIALKNISKLKDPMLVIAWLNQINFRVCFQLQKKQQKYDAEMIDYSSIDSDSAGDSIRSSTRTPFVGNNPEDMAIRIDSQEYIMNQILKASLYGSPGDYFKILPKFETWRDCAAYGHQPKLRKKIPKQRESPS